jgi:5-methylcytosine-specific restriction endonuclease McrA
LKGFLRTCADVSCGVLVSAASGPYCAEHTRVQAAAKSIRDNVLHSGSDWRWVYKTRRWAGLRREVLRDQPWCAEVGCFELATDVDHVVPLQEGGPPFDRVNLRGLCRGCHSAKTNKEVRTRAAGRL